MPLDAETIRWLLSGAFFLGGSVISLLLSRETRRMDRAIDEHAQTIANFSGRLSTFKLHVAETYVSKTDLEKQLGTHLDPLRADLRELKTDVKSLLRRP